MGGTTGESVSMSAEEREEVVRSWNYWLVTLNADKDINLYVHVGMDSIFEAARHAKRVTSDDVDRNKLVKGIFCMTPNYFKPGSVEILADTLAAVAEANPALPFWYYHIPAMSNVDLDMFSYAVTRVSKLTPATWERE